MFLLLSLFFAQAADQDPVVTLLHKKANDVTQVLEETSTGLPSERVKTVATILTLDDLPVDNMSELVSQPAVQFMCRDLLGVMNKTKIIPYLGGYGRRLMESQQNLEQIPTIKRWMTSIGITDNFLLDGMDGGLGQTVADLPQELSLFYMIMFLYGASGKVNWDVMANSTMNLMGTIDLCFRTIKSASTYMSTMLFPPLPQVETDQSPLDNIWVSFQNFMVLPTLVAMKDSVENSYEDLRKIWDTVQDLANKPRPVPELEMKDAADKKTQWLKLWLDLTRAYAPSKEDENYDNFKKDIKQLKEKFPQFKDEFSAEIQLFDAIKGA